MSRYLVNSVRLYRRLPEEQFPCFLGKILLYFALFFARPEDTKDRRSDRNAGETLNSIEDVTR